MSWPTVSKGIFYKGFNKGKQQGRAPKERSTQTVSTSAHAPLTKESARLNPASNPLTKESMRKPFSGGSKKK